MSDLSRITDEQMAFIWSVRKFVADNEDMLGHVVEAAASGLQDRVESANRKALELECVLMHNICIHQIPGITEITWKTIADKLQELADKRVMCFNWSHIIEAMNNSPETMAGKKKRSKKEIKDAD